MAGSALFDQAAYEAAVGTSFSSRHRAAAHYVEHGEAAGLAPGPEFDPVYYRDAYPDLADLPDGLLVHFIRHGRADGRRGAFPLPLAAGRHAFDPLKRSVLVVTHDVSRTGAPILAWNIALHLDATHNVIVAVVDAEGELFPNLLDVATAVVGPFTRADRAEDVMRHVVAELDRRYDLDFAVINSVASFPLLLGLAPRGIATVSIVHEIASPTFPEGRFELVCTLSDRVLFDAQLQVDSVRRRWPALDAGRFAVFHQGACRIPRAAGAAAGSKPAPEPAVPEPAVPTSGAAAGEPLPVVLGLGTVSMRKGVDLFVACAQKLVQAIGPGRVRFIWVGHRREPDPEGHYYEWVREYIARADLEDVVSIRDPIDDLDQLYRSAHVLLSTSRLDPFPNVAIDAARLGLPVICFARGNGFAEFLEADARTRDLAVPYLDVGAAAEATLRLLADEELRRALGAALAERSAVAFAMEPYVAKVRALARSAADRKAADRAASGDFAVTGPAVAAPR